MTAWPWCLVATPEVVLEAVAALIAREARRIAEIKGGALFKAEIDDTLRKHGIVE